MSDPISLPQVATLAAQLPPADRKQLAEMILRDLAAESPTSGPPRRRSWREIRGSVPHQLCGEDAQAWVTRARRESDEHCDRQGRSPG